MAGGVQPAPERISHRDIVVLPPEPGSPPEDWVGARATPADVRVAWVGGRAVGAYRIVRLEATLFEIAALTVAEPWRRRGVGTWLLRHALGLAESRGARAVQARPGGAAAFFARSGFAPGPERMRLELVPE